MEAASPGQLAGGTVSASREEIPADSAGHPGPVFRVGLSSHGVDAYGINAMCYVFSSVSIVLWGGVTWSKTKQPHLTSFRGAVPGRDLCELPSVSRLPVEDSQASFWPCARGNYAAMNNSALGMCVGTRV